MSVKRGSSVTLHVGTSQSSLLPTESAWRYVNWLTIDQFHSPIAPQVKFFSLSLLAERALRLNQLPSNETELQWTTLAQRRRLYALKLAHKCILRMGPVYLHNNFQSISSITDRQTRGSSTGKLYLSRPRPKFYKELFDYSTGYFLPSSIRTLKDIGPFTRACKAVSISIFTLIYIPVFLFCFCL